MLEYHTPSPTGRRSVTGTSVLCVLVSVSVAGLVGSFSVTSGDVGAPLLLVALGAAVASVPVLVVFRGRLPIGIAVVGWTIAGLGSIALVVFLFVLFAIAGGLFAP